VAKNLALRTGTFDFEQTDSSGEWNGDFVYVPKNYDFDADDGMETIFKALKTDLPKFVFQFGDNYGLSPLANHAKKDDLKNASLTVTNRKENEHKAESIMSTIPSEGVMFLITKTYGGNVLSRIALKAAEKKNIRSLALLTCEKNNDANRITCEINNKDDNETDLWNETRRFLNAKDFLDCVVPVGDEVQKTIKAMADYTQSEKDLCDATPHFIPGLLSDECSHRLVFETQASLERFKFLFEKSAWTGYFAAGSSQSEMQCAYDALRYGKPLIVLPGTGIVADVVHAFKKQKKENEHASNLNLLGDNRFYRQSEDALSQAAKNFTGEEGGDNSKRSASQKDPEPSTEKEPPNEAQHLVHNMASHSGMFTIDSICLIQSSDLVLIQKKIMKLMSRDFSDEQLDGSAADISAVKECIQLHEELETAAKRYWRWGLALHLAIVFVTIISVVFSSAIMNMIVEETIDLTAQGDTPTNATKKTSMISNSLTIFFTFLLTIFRGFDTFMNPLIKYVRLHYAAAELKSEEFRFRTRTGVYKARYWCTHEEERMEDDSARKVFEDRTSNIFTDCLESEAKHGYLKSINFCDCRSYHQIKKKDSKPGDEEEQGNRQEDSEGNKKGKVLEESEEYERKVLEEQLKEYKRKAQEDHKQFGHLLIDEYVKNRLDEKRKGLSREASVDAIWRNILQFLILLLTALGPVLSSPGFWPDGKSQAKYIPFTLVFVASLRDVMRFSELDSGTVSCNEASTVMTEVKKKWRSDTKSYLPDHKDEIVNRTEDAILERVKKSISQTENVSLLRKNSISSAQAKKIRDSMKKNGTVFSRRPNKKYPR
jgi:hypothetical protein